MGMYDEVRCARLPDMKFQSKDIYGVSLNSRQTYPDMSLFFIDRSGAMFVIRNALISDEGMDRDVLKSLLDKYPTTLAGIGCVAFFPIDHFTLFDGDNYFAHVDDGRVVSIEKMPLDLGDRGFNAMGDWNARQLRNIKVALG